MRAFLERLRLCTQVTDRATERRVLTRTGDIRHLVQRKPSPSPNPQNFRFQPVHVHRLDQMDIEPSLPAVLNILFLAEPAQSDSRQEFTLGAKLPHQVQSAPVWKSEVAD